MSFFLRYWRGEAPLGETFWVFGGVIVPLVAFFLIIVAFALAPLLPAAARGPLEFGSVFAVAGGAVVVDTVAVWRSARRSANVESAGAARGYVLLPLILAAMVLLVWLLQRAAV